MEGATCINCIRGRHHECEASRPEAFECACIKCHPPRSVIAKYGAALDVAIRTAGDGEDEDPPEHIFDENARQEREEMEWEARNKKGDPIQTYTGRKFWAADPDPDDIDPRDITHALSLLCRYGGHCREFYSVAQHSVLVSELCHPDDALWGLLHDAAEAYLVDVPRPIKKHLHGYSDMEARITECVCRKFGLPNEMPKSVVIADDLALGAEARQLMGPLNPQLRDYVSKIPEIAVEIVPRHWRFAKSAFERRLRELLAGRG